MWGEPKNMETEELEEEFSMQQELRKRSEKLKSKINEHLKNYREIMQVLDEQEEQIFVCLKLEREFLENLPKRVQKRLEIDRAVLELRKQILEMLKSSE